MPFKNDVKVGKVEIGFSRPLFLRHQRCAEHQGGKCDENAHDYGDTRVCGGREKAGRPPDTDCVRNGEHRLRSS
jgi:hypothetical protein